MHLKVILLNKFNIQGGLEISSIADVPSGTGMGSSSSFTVGLLHNLHAVTNQQASKEALAAGACQVEIDLLKEPIGKQDQYAAAFGGLNFYVIDRNGFITVSKNILTYEQEITLTRNLYLVYSGQQRPASSILQDQKNNHLNMHELHSL